MDDNFPSSSQPRTRNNNNNDFKINSLNLKDADSGKTYYQSFDDFSQEEHEARVPKKILKCPSFLKI